MALCLGGTWSVLSDLVLWGPVLVGCCVVYVLLLRDEKCVVQGSLGVSTDSLQVMEGVITVSVIEGLSIID